MHNNRLTTLRTLFDICKASISVILNGTLPIEEIFADIVYRKKYQCDSWHIGSIIVFLHFHCLVSFLPKHCIDVQVINLCNLCVKRYHFPPLLGELKNRNVSSPSTWHVMIVMIEVSQCYFPTEATSYKEFKRYVSLRLMTSTCRLVTHC